MLFTSDSTWCSNAVSSVSTNRLKITQQLFTAVYVCTVQDYARKMTAPIVTIKEGQLKGKISQNHDGKIFYSFLGIPYASPPVGELRFKAPVAAQSWSGLRDATQEGPECPSRHMYFGFQIGTEDNCLNLNVYTRQLLGESDDSLTPVMVWIHGGGFLYGSNKSELYGPDYLMTEDIVLVCINYRLGVFGFLSLEDPSLEVPGNAGLKDMILALKWIQRNIKQFNGDPNNVTIFGESAGAASVHYLCLSPLSNGLFHKAIAQSGSSLNCWAKGCTNGKIIANNLGFKEKEEKSILEYLKNLSASKIVKAQHKSQDTFTADLIRPFGPVVENTSTQTAFLTEDPVDIIKTGKFRHIPLIMGYTSKEGIFFNAVRQLMPGAKLSNDFESEISFDLKIVKGSEKSKEIANKIQKFYFAEEKPSEENLDNTFLLKTDTQFLHGIYRSVCYQKLHSSAPIYFYRMSLDTSLNYFKIISTAKVIHLLLLCYYLSYKSGEGRKRNFFMRLSKSLPSHTPIGVCHADDLGYLFKSFLTLKPEPNSLEEISIRKFVKLWTNFAKTGNPTPYQNDTLLNNIHWKPVTKEETNFLDIDKELKTGSNPDLERMQFWDSIYNLN